MEFAQLLEVVGDEPVFDTGLLLAGAAGALDVRKQLSRWVKAGRLYQLRRGLYALAPPFQKVRPHPFVIANHMVRGSYVSSLSALAQHGLIPDVVPVTTSVSSGRPAAWTTPLGTFQFRHIKLEWLHGYGFQEVSPGQHAFVATLEKALLDLIHLQPHGDAPEYLRELRLQNLDLLDVDRLERQAELSGSPKLRRAAAFVARLASAETMEYEAL